MDLQCFKLLNYRNRSITKTNAVIQLCNNTNDFQVDFLFFFQICNINFWKVCHIPKINGAQNDQTWFYKCPTPTIYSKYLALYRGKKNNNSNNNKNSKTANLCRGRSLSGQQLLLRELCCILYIIIFLCSFWRHFEKFVAQYNRISGWIFLKLVEDLGGSKSNLMDC